MLTYWLSKAPAQDVVEYKLVPFNSGFDHAAMKYMGYPTHEIDDSWNDLYQSTSRQSLSKRQGRKG